MKTLLQQAIDPNQYDSQDMHWLAGGDGDGPTRLFIKEFLEPELGNLKGKAVLDIGCGTGWLSKVVQGRGAADYVGIEPSKRNFQAARKYYPKAKFMNCQFEDFHSENQFDLIICVMATEHIADLKAAFQKCNSLLKPKGRLIIIAGDIKAFTTERFDYQLTIGRISADEAVVHTKRPTTSVNTTDIIRSVPLFFETAEQAGLKTIKAVPMYASKLYISLVPQYKNYPKLPVFQLLEFGKSGI